MASSVEKQVFYAGRVQGVGFRYGAKLIATGFEQAHADGRIFGQAACEHATGRSTADDQVVEAVRHANCARSRFLSSFPVAVRGSDWPVRCQRSGTL